MKILITGATGFIGRNLIKYLLRDNAHDISILTRDEKKARDLFGEKVRIYRGDITDVGSLIGPFKDKDVVIHLAALMSNYEHEGRRRYYEVNVSGLRNVLVSCDASLIKRFVHISSAGVYGDTGNAPVKEDREYGSRLSAYEWSKKEAELTLLKYTNEYSIPFTILRLSQLYGPWMYYGWVDTIRAIKNGEMLIPGQGSSKIHLLNIHDCIEAIGLSLSNDNAVNKVYNIAGPEPLAMSEVFEIISSLLGVSAPRSVPYLLPYTASCLLGIMPRWLKSDRLRLLTPHRVRFFRDNHIYNISLANKELGYQPRVNARDGFNELISWCKEEGFI